MVIFVHQTTATLTVILLKLQTTVLLVQKLTVLKYKAKDKQESVLHTAKAQTATFTAVLMLSVFVLQKLLTT
jgi:hypothetical protein